MKPGLYIHVPFCAGKCVYCAFNSVEAPGGVPPDYLDAVVRDAGASAHAWEGAEFGSVYFGGGTPSLVEPEGIARMIDAFRSSFAVAPDAEITLEANPGSLAAGRLRGYREAGVNRLSVGVQSLGESELRFLGRRHTSGQALDALDSARRAGFSNLSCDVMIGVPGQDAAGLEATLGALAPRSDHISCYLLTVEAGTPLEAMAGAGEVAFPDDEGMASLFETAAAALGRHGMTRYEISNWARPGFESRHNRVYWSRGEYLGLGAGASSFRNGARSKREERPVAYAESVLLGRDPVRFLERVGQAAAMEEEVMLRLRTAAGLDLARLASEYGCRPERARPLLGRLRDEGLIVESGKHIQLTAKGVLVSDAVICNISESLSFS